LKEIKTMTRQEFFKNWNAIQENGESITSPADMTLEEFAASDRLLYSDFNENEEGASYLKIVDYTEGNVELYMLSNNDENAERL
jgi:hypothetical protein